MRTVYECEEEGCNSRFYSKIECRKHEAQPVIEGDFNGLVVKNDSSDEFTFFVSLPSLNLKHERLYMSSRLKQWHLSEEYSNVISHLKDEPMLFTRHGYHFSVPEIQERIDSGKYSAVSSRELEIITGATKDGSRGTDGNYIDDGSWFNHRTHLDHSGLWRTLQKPQKDIDSIFEGMGEAIHQIGEHID